MSAESSAETTKSVIAVEPVLARWNTFSPHDAAREVLPCCGSVLWAQQLTSSRPIHDLADLLHRSDAIWQKLPSEAWEEAFATHPRIGARKAPSTATAQSATWSSQEQSSVSASSNDVQQQLAHANDLYEQRFGRTYIVCATGKTAPEMLAILERRLINDSDREFAEAVEQQRLITRLRLKKMVAAMSGISTHILDVALGRPAAAITVHLSHDANDRSQRIASCITDSEGRVKQLLPGSLSLTAGTYRLSFETGIYFDTLGMKSLYPVIEIAFVVRDPAAHYHIPLLLAANGYSTYRGT